MPVTALLILNDADAMPTVLGMPAIEFQIRQAWARGAAHIVILVGRVPPVLLRAIDRMRRAGISIDMARTLSDAVDFVHPEDRVWLIAPSVFHDAPDLAARLAEGSAIILAVRNEPGNDMFEIIDRERRWTGWAAFPGTMLRDIRAMIGDWEPAPTILRHLLQRRANVLICDGGMTITRIGAADGRRQLERTLLTKAAEPAASPGEALLTAPAARMTSRIVIEAGIDTRVPGLVAVVLATSATISAAAGFIALPCLLMAVALIAITTDRTLARTRMPLGRDGAVAQVAISAAINLVLLLSGSTLMHASGQWGWLLLAAVLGGLLTLLKAPLAPQGSRVFMADEPSSLIVVAAAALVGAPMFGLALATAHATLSVAAREFGKGATRA